MWADRKKRKKGRMRCYRCKLTDEETSALCLVSWQVSIMWWLNLCSYIMVHLLAGGFLLAVPRAAIPLATLPLDTHTYAPSKGRNLSGFLKVRTYFSFIATQHCFTSSMLLHPPEKKLALCFKSFLVLSFRILSSSDSQVTTGICLWAQRITVFF